MESKELDELREKLKYTYIDYGMALVVSGHKLDKYLDEALKIIGSHVTAEVERAIQTTLEIVAKRDPSYGLPDGDYFHIRVDADTYWQSIPEEVKRILQPQPQKGKES